MITSVVTIAVFTAGITSSLTKREIQGNVQTESDLGVARVGAVAGSVAESYLARRHITHRSFQTVGEGLKALQNDQLEAFVHDKSIMGWIILRDFATTLRVLDTSILEQNYAIALPKGSPLRAAVDLGVLENLEKDWWIEAQYRFFGKK